MFKNIIFEEKFNDFEFYTKLWNQKIISDLTNIKQAYKVGNYAGMTGPTYETGSEIRFLKNIGADAVGMSIIHESMVARYLNMNLTACSLITNTLSETNTKELTHKEVLEIAVKSRNSMYNYFKAAVRNII
jgi:purine-nucleoside phosphorylase